MISERENTLRAIEFRYPEWIPIQMDLMPCVFYRHGTALAEMMRRHPLLFGAAEVDAAVKTVPPAGTEYERRFTDDWECGWLEVQAGILGQVVGHPLADWAKLDGLEVPDPARQWDWASVRRRCAQARERGELVNGYMGIYEGGFFDRLQFLRGLDNLLVDLIERPPELARLIALLLDYNLRLIRLWLEAGAELIHFHGDIGMQNSLMFSPDTFRAVLKPAYREMFQACRRGGAHVKYSSDGCLLEIVDDLVQCGVSYHDPQVRACGIDGIARVYGGKLCAMVDIDEQMLPFASPAEVEAQVREIVAKVGRPAGGLMLYACPSGDVPLANIEAICTAWEACCAPGAWGAAGGGGGGRR
jgi:uroporphyrinogen decarboxylase